MWMVILASEESLSFLGFLFYALIAIIAMFLLLLVGASVAAPAIEEEEKKKRLELEAKHQVALAQQAQEHSGQREQAQLLLAAAKRELEKHQLHALPASGAADQTAIINQKLLNQARTGRVMHVLFNAIAEGRLLLQWCVDRDSPILPMVTGFRNGEKIFCEHAFSGEHADQIQRGVRYYYAFQVKLNGQRVEREEEFFFQIVIPTLAQANRQKTLVIEPPPPKPPPPAPQAPVAREDEADRQARLIAEKARALTAKAAALADALRKAELDLRSKGFDEETIQHMLAQLEAELRKELGS
ncbi:MAG: hypothetical protein JWN34_4818 [Bryobacterales bacterium]|nr:hypothetical protein [Bryobacterales bacterium]